MRNLLLLPVLAIAAHFLAAAALSQADLSAPLYLRPVTPRCAINIGKDRSFAPLHAPEFVFYDGARCKAQISENATTSFVAGDSRTLRDVEDAAKGLADGVTLKAQVLETNLRHDRMVNVRRRNGVVRCGARGLREVLFLEASRNGEFEVRGQKYKVRQGVLYAFVDDVILRYGRRGMKQVGGQRLCFFKGGFSQDGIDSADGRAGGSDRAGKIAGCVFGVAVLALILCGTMCLIHKKLRHQEGAPAGK